MVFVLFSGDTSREKKKNDGFNYSLKEREKLLKGCAPEKKPSERSAEKLQTAIGHWKRVQSGAKNL